jgi:hypothetical protein
MKRARRLSLLGGKLHIRSRPMACIAVILRIRLVILRIRLFLRIHLLPVSVEKKGNNPYKKKMVSYKKMVKPPCYLLLLLRGSCSSTTTPFSEMR